MSNIMISREIIEEGKEVHYMYKILIADDEPIERQAFRVIIEKNIGSVGIIEEAENGRQAIEKCHELRPDIVLMDIKMPGINGIEAIEQIVKTFPNTRFVVISAYDYFNFAQQAIALGVEDYLLKPVKRDKLVNTINQMIQQIEEERKKRKRELELVEKLNNIIPLIESEFAYSMIFGDTEKIKTLKYEELLDIRFDLGFCMVIFLNKDGYPEKINNQLGRSFINQKVLDTIGNVVKNLCSCVVSPLISDKVGIFISRSPAQDEYSIRVWSINVAHKLVEEIFRENRVRVNIGIGRSYPGAENMSISYIQAVSSLSYISQPGDIVHYSDIDFANKIHFVYPIEKENLLCERVKAGDVEGSIKILKEIFDIFTQSFQDDVKRIKPHIFELAVVLSRTAYEMGIEEDIFNVLHGIENNEFFHEERAREIYLWVQAKLIELVQKIQDARQNNINILINKAQQYIEDNYSHELTLEDVARAVVISPHYFSKLFKAESGENFIDYLTRVRIKHAKRLLERPENSVKDVCFKVGYNDPNYFSRVFKKEVGLSPSEYRGRFGL